MKEFEQFLIKKITRYQAYGLGFDCGKNGANTTNCAFSIFSSPENTKAWERGKRDAEVTNSNPNTDKKV